MSQEEAVTAPQEAEASAEQEQSFWEQKGFLPEIARLSDYLASEPEKFMYNAEVRFIIQYVTNAKTVEDFADKSTEALQQYLTILRRELPRQERDTVTFLSQLTRARTVQVENVDFI